uniref:Uncharacterized protein n=1 Tax=Timema tahoe TaxID=61484 RepID=A0A7R9NYE1_9NEOP|nr:unnamed protein product [Timema tahoe]
MFSSLLSDILSLTRQALRLDPPIDQLLEKIMGKLLRVIGTDLQQLTHEEAHGELKPRILVLAPVSSVLVLAPLLLGPGPQEHVDLDDRANCLTELHVVDEILRRLATTEQQVCNIKNPTRIDIDFPLFSPAVGSDNNNGFQDNYA